MYILYKAYLKLCPLSHINDETIYLDIWPNEGIWLKCELQVTKQLVCWSNEGLCMGDQIGHLGKMSLEWLQAPQK